MLEKKGNSNSDERMRLMEAFYKLCPDARVRCLCGDREFVGQNWLRYVMLEPAMPCRLGIRASDKIERDGKALAAQVVCPLKSRRSATSEGTLSGVGLNRSGQSPAVGERQAIGCHRYSAR